MITIFIPYIESNHLGFNELKYALRSWEKHFLEPFKIFIIGDCPKWLQNVEYIKHNQILDVEENFLKDAISKFDCFLQSFTDEYFIRSYDDIYLINDCKLPDIQRVRGLKHIQNNIPSGWKTQKLRTFSLIRHKFNGFHTETHIPEYFEKSKMIRIFEKYKVKENNVLTSTLYNLEYNFDNIELIDKTKVKAGFYGWDSWDSWGRYKDKTDIGNICSDKLFLNHNDQGLSEVVKEYLMEKFPNKSSFEK